MERNMLMVLNAEEYFFKTGHIPNTVSYCNGIIPSGEIVFHVFLFGIISSFVA